MIKIFLNARVLNFPFSGVQRFVKEVSQELKEYVTLVGPPKSLSSGFTGQMWEQFVLPRIVGKNNVLFSPNYSGPIGLEKQIVSVHDLAPFDYPDNLRLSYVLWYRFLIPVLLQRCAGIHTVSEFTKNKIVSILRIDENKVKVIPNGVSQHFFCDSNSQKIQDKVQFPFRYFLYIGSIQPRKNLNRLLCAWSQIEGLIPPDVWLLVGGAKGKSNVFRSLKLQSMPNRVLFLGFIQEETLPALYHNSLGFIFVSLYEGFGIPVLEAMASGTPIIASNATALPEVVGNCGILVNPYSTKEISEAILRLTFDEELRTKLSLCGLERADQFRWNKTARELLRFIMERFGS